MNTSDSRSFISLDVFINMLISYNDFVIFNFEIYIDENIEKEI